MKRLVGHHVLPSLPAAPQAPAGESFAQYMARIAPRFSADAAGATMKMQQALAKHGLSAIGQLSARPDLIPAVDAEFST